MQLSFYGRISPRPDLETSPSPDQQFGAVRHWLQTQGFKREPMRFEDIGKSRDDMDRPALWKAIQACPGGVLIALALDRIGDVVAVETVMRLCARQKTQVITVMEGIQENDADSELMRVIRGGIARHSKRKISASTRIHLAEKKRQGYRVSRFPSFGYRFIKVGTIKTKRGYLKDDWRVVVDPYEARVIEAVKRAYKSGMGVSEIVRRFRRRRVKVRAGLLTHKRAYNILKMAKVPVRGRSWNPLAANHLSDSDSNTIGKMGKVAPSFHDPEARPFDGRASPSTEHQLGLVPPHANDAGVLDGAE
jgi:DNA invertase Pin-like site-specific DNA recombinase